MHRGGALEARFWRLGQDFQVCCDTQVADGVGATRVGQLTAIGLWNSTVEKLTTNCSLDPNHAVLSHHRKPTSLLIIAPRSSTSVMIQVLASSGSPSATIWATWIEAGCVIHFRSERNPFSTV